MSTVHRKRFLTCCFSMIRKRIRHIRIKYLQTNTNSHAFLGPLVHAQAVDTRPLSLLPCGLGTRLCSKVLQLASGLAVFRIIVRYTRCNDCFNEFLCTLHGCVPYHIHLQFILSCIEFQQGCHPPCCKWIALLFVRGKVFSTVQLTSSLPIISLSHLDTL